jgi:hypothetical protein
VLAGGFWVRGWNARTSGGAAEPPDVTFTDGVVAVGDVRITLSIAPHPPYAFEKIHLRVRAEDHGRAVRIENARVSFEMRMPMGEHRYVLVPRADGWLEADAVLPMCGSGDARWFAVVEGSFAGGRRVNARYQLDLAKVER